MNNDITLSKTINLLKNILIDIQENKGASHFPNHMQERMNEAAILVDDYYKQLINNPSTIDFKKLRELTK